MTRVVNIKSSGQVAVLFDQDQQSLAFEVGNPLLPAAVSASLSTTLSAMQASGASMLHMEQDTFRAFTHTLRDGLVSYEAGTGNQLFTVVMGAQASLIAALTPPPDPVV